MTAARKLYTAEIPFAEIADVALGPLASLMHTWAPGGRETGGHYVAANPVNPHPKGKTGSFRVNLATGRWCDLRTGNRGGDAISLYAYLYDMRQGEAAREVAGLLGLTPDLPPERRARMAAGAARERARREAEQAEKRVRTLAYCRRLWDEASTEIAAVSRYLLARGIRGAPPANVRFARLKHTETGHPLHPVMLARVDGPDDELIGLHRTYLAEDDRGKAAVEAAKKMLGEHMGGAVRLADPPGAVMIVGEGIETCLAVAALLPRAAAKTTKVWALLGIENLRRFTAPAGVERLIVLADRDDDGVGFEAAKAASKANGERIDSVVLDPPRGSDFNDMVREGGPRAVALRRVLREETAWPTAS